MRPSSSEKADSTTGTFLNALPFQTSYGLKKNIVSLFPLVLITKHSLESITSTTMFRKEYQTSYGNPLKSSVLKKVKKQIKRYFNLFNLQYSQLFLSSLCSTISI